MKTDVLVIGGGPAGSSAALFLAHQGAETLIIDKDEFPRRKPCGDGLGPRAVAVLQDIGLEPWLAANYFRCDRIRVVSPSGLSVASKMPADAFPVDYGYIAPRSDLDDRLIKEAVSAGAGFLQKHRAKELLFNPRGRVSGARTIDQNSRPADIRADLVVVATGSKSLNSARTRGTKQRAIALSTYVDGVKGIDDCINICFSSRLAHGYSWLFPTSPGTANVGVGVVAPSRDALKKVRLKDELSAFLEGRKAPVNLEKAKRTARIVGSTMNMSFGTGPVTQPGLACVGDAAGLVSPINGEGVGPALESSRLLAHSVAGRLGTTERVDAALKDFEAAMARRYLTYYKLSWLFHRVFARPERIDQLVRRALKDRTLRESLVGLLANTVHPKSMLKISNARLFLPRP